MIGYCNVKSFDAGDSAYDSGALVTNGRSALVSLVCHSKEVSSRGSVYPIQFRNGSGSGDILYKVRPFSGKTTASTAYELTYQVDMGGAGILFTDGIFFEWVTAGGESEGVDNVIVFFTGGEPA